MNFFRGLKFAIPASLIAWALLALLVFAIASNAHAAEGDYDGPHHFNVVFSPETTIQEVAWQALNVVDLEQTRDIAAHPDKFQEVGQVAGPCTNHPTKKCATLTIAAFAVLHYMVTLGIENLVQENPDYRVLQRVWEYSSLGYKGALVYQNHSIGLKP